MTRPSIDVLQHLTADQAHRVRALNESAAIHDGAEPISEAFALRLDDAPGAGRVRHVVAVHDGEVVGYGVSEVGAEPSAELVVAPAARRQGVGSAVLAALREGAGEPLRAWAHGNLTVARAFGAACGATDIRTLMELRRPATSVEVPPAAEGIAVRTFVPGADDDAWLALNAAAFASHPEQGQLTQADLADRMAEAWFDAAGFFLAERKGELLAFHWTKIADPEPHPQPDGALVGEVYVVGVAPSAQGLGLGRLMTATGLRYLHERGVSEFSLYVDGENTSAVALYRSMGFVDHHVDSQWLTR